MKKLTPEEGISLLAKEDILKLGQSADEVRRTLHPDNAVTFIVDRNINYTNICESECKFCAFYRKKGQNGAYLLNKEEILAKVEETVEAGGTQIMLQGGLNKELGLDYYVDLLTAIKENYDITIHSFSPTEILYFANQSCQSIKKILEKLKAAGLDSLPGGGAEILVDEVRRRVSPKKISADDWLTVMETAHEVGLETTATMVIGMGETIAQRIEHMEKVRKLQEKRGMFRAFIMWSYQPGNTELGGEKVSSWEYLRTLALARIYLTNFKHIQGSWVTQGTEIGQLTLAFGANDLGSVMLEENVVKAAGTSHAMTAEKMVNLIYAAGKIPKQRDTKYNIIKSF